MKIALNINHSKCVEPTTENGLPKYNNSNSYPKSFSNDIICNVNSTITQLHNTITSSA